MTEEPSRVTILLVDDIPTNLSVLVDILGREGFNISIATSGERALQQVSRVTPDIILLDVLMPGIDGFETCRRLKADPTARDIPVIFMTALSETVDKMRGFEAGGVDYIIKPIQHEEVLARLNAHLTIRRQQQQLREQNIRLHEQNTLVEQQRAQLQQLNADKDKFFSIMAHDVKNPLVGFLSIAELLKDNVEQWSTDEIVKFIGHIHESAKTLFELLENLLTWSRMQQGTLAFELQHVRLNWMVGRTFELLKAHADQKEIALVREIGDEFGVHADPYMMDAVIRNLVFNAIKFTKPGGRVTVSATQHGDRVHISVTDTGIGIPADKVPGLFQINSRNQRTGTAGETGTGLGLILCKEFIERNNGQIWAESVAGQGTTFHVTLPVSESLPILADDEVDALKTANK